MPDIDLSRFPTFGLQLLTWYAVIAGGVSSLVLGAFVIADRIKSRRSQQPINRRPA